MDPIHLLLLAGVGYLLFRKKPEEQAQIPAQIPAQLVPAADIPQVLPAPPSVPKAQPIKSENFFEAPLPATGTYAFAEKMDNGVMCTVVTFIPEGVKAEGIITPDDKYTPTDNPSTIKIGDFQAKMKESLSKTVNGQKLLETKNPPIFYGPCNSADGLVSELPAIKSALTTL